MSPIGVRCYEAGGPERLWGRGVDRRSEAGVEDAGQGRGSAGRAGQRPARAAGGGESRGDCVGGGRRRR